MEINTHKLTAKIKGLIPVVFKSLIEIVAPTKNSVSNNKRFETITIVVVNDVGRICVLLIKIATINRMIKYGIFIFSPFVLNKNIEKIDKGIIHSVRDNFTVVAIRKASSP